jgi:transposase InsO family protein
VPLHLAAGNVSRWERAISLPPFRGFQIFTADGPNKLWVSDITEHPTDTGKVYLGVVLDAFSAG